MLALDVLWNVRRKITYISALCIWEDRNRIVSDGAKLSELKHNMVSKGRVITSIDLFYFPLEGLFHVVSWFSKF